MKEVTTEKPASEKAESRSPLGLLSSSGFTILGLLYLMGYIIVNGYQAEYLNYSASAIQLKHVAAGLLYSFLTFLQVSVVANLFVVEWSDRQERAEAGKTAVPHGSGELSSDPRAQQREESGKAATPARPGDSVASAGSQAQRGVRQPVWAALKGAWSALGETIRWLREKRNLAYSLIKVIFVHGAMFWFILHLGKSALPDRYDGIFIVKTCWAWILTNVLMAGLIAITITSMAKQHARAVEELYRRFQSSLSGSEPKAETIVAPDTSKLKVDFAEAVTGRWLAIPLLAGFALYFSLTSFQGLYGRLRPDYGGGALYRVALHMTAVSNQSGIATDKSTAPANQPTPASESAGKTVSLPDAIRRKLEARDSWLLLVDKDASFLYLLVVDKTGNRSLTQIALSEVKALEVLPAPPIHPADVAFFMQLEENNKASG